MKLCGEDEEREGQRRRSDGALILSEPGCKTSTPGRNVGHPPQLPLLKGTDRDMSRRIFCEIRY